MNITSKYKSTTYIYIYNIKLTTTQLIRQRLEDGGGGRGGLPEVDWEGHRVQGA